MDKEFVPYEIALELKQLEFNEPCLGHYDNPENSVWITDSPPYYANKENVCLSPLYQQAFRWLYKQLGRDGFGVMPIDIDKCNEELRKLIEIVKEIK
jgi:hypothetical protein